MRDTVYNTGSCSSAMESCWDVSLTLIPVIVGPSAVLGSDVHVMLKRALGRLPRAELVQGLWSKLGASFRVSEKLKAFQVRTAEAEQLDMQCKVRISCCCSWAWHKSQAFSLLQFSTLSGRQ